MRRSREEQAEIMMAMRERGWNNQKIAEKMRRKESTVAKYIGSKDWYCANYKRIEKAKKLEGKGVSRRKICEITGLSSNAIRKYLGKKIIPTVENREYAGAARGRPGISGDALQRARELEAKGCSRAEITRMTGMCSQTLRKYLGQRGRKTVSSKQIARMHELRARGWSRSRIAREVGCAAVTVADHLGGYRKMDAPSRQQLCWSCARSAAGKDRQCSWDAKLQPVEGWAVDEAGFVVSCPEFEEARI